MMSRFSQSFSPVGTWQRSLVCAILGDEGHPPKYCWLQCRQVPKDHMHCTAATVLPWPLFLTEASELQTQKTPQPC